MNISREFSVKIKNFLDNYLAPNIRDSKLLFAFIYKIAFGKNYNDFLNFRENVHSFDKKKLNEFYEMMENYLFQTDTDLNKKTLNIITRSIIGKQILDIGCGRGFLAKKLCKKYNVTAADYYLSKDTNLNDKEIRYVKANIEEMPFKNKAFDTVISTHTLEHTLNINKAIDELRRVCKKRLIIVIPKERPYKFGFNLHLHFFPYKYNIYAVFGRDIKCWDLDGDWFLIEDLK